MDNNFKINNFYLGVFSFLIIFVFISYTFRLFSLQVLDENVFKERSFNQTQRGSILLAQRGNILARDSSILTENTSSFTLFLDLGKLKEYRKNGKEEDLMIFLSRYLKLSINKLNARIGQALLQREPRIILKENLSYSEFAPLAEKFSYYDAISWENMSERQYNDISSTIHLLGYSGKINQKELRLYYDRDYSPNSIIGKMGVESIYDEFLRGKNGIRYISVDAKGLAVGESDSTSPIRGSDLYLNIDPRIQELSEKALGERYGSVVVLKPTTGEVLAMVSYPFYDPHHLEETILDEKEEFHSFFNKAIQGNYPAASSFKVIMAAAILQEKAFDPKRKIYCPGYLQVGDRIFHCHDLNGHGWLDLEGALRDSCNIYFYTVGMEYLGIDKINQYASIFGLGQETGIDLPNEGKGFIPSPSWKKAEFGVPWVGGDTANISIGQGFMTATPLQMANVVSLIINEGTIYKPQILNHVENASVGIKTKYKPQVLKETQALSSSTYSFLKRAMRTVVRDGSLKWIINTNIPIAGKTGTAEHWGYDNNASWFISYGPYNAPEEEQLVVVVMVEPRNKWEWWAPKATNLIYHGIFNNLTYEEVIKDLRPWYVY